MPGQPRAAARRQRTVLIVLAVAYVVSVGLLFASHVREFADESDNLLGGVLLARGARLYLDYFSNHMPLAYYVAAIPAAVGAVRVEQFRLFTNAALVVTTLGLAFAFRNRIRPEILGLWAVLVLFAHTLQFGEMLTAGTTAGIGTLAAGLLFFTTPGLRFDWQRGLWLSLAVFVAIQSALLAVYPLAVLAVAYVWVRKARDIGQTLRLAGLVLAPHALLLGYLALNGSLFEFLYQAVQFNQAYYSQFLMSGSPLQMLHDWEAQYRTYVLLSLSEPLGIQAVLVAANAVAAVLVARARGVLVGLAYYLFAALSHIRTEDGYYLVSYVSLALIGVAALDALRTRRWLVPGASGLALLAWFGVRVAQTYDFSPGPPRVVDEVPLVLALTQPGERIFVAPYDPYVYLATDRMPAATSPFYFPWQALDPRTEGQLIADLRARRPAVVVFRQDELVNGQWLPREYGRRVLEALAADGYVVLDAGYPTVLVPRERVEEMRGLLNRRAG